MAKKKSSSVRNIPDKNALYLPRSINFVSPLTIEECEQRLRELQSHFREHGPLRGTPLQTHFYPKNINDQGFALAVHHYKTVRVWAIGELTKVDDTNTEVTTITGAGRGLLLYVGFDLFIWLGLIGFILISQRDYEAIVAMLLALIMIPSFRLLLIKVTKDHFVRAIEQTLEKPQ